MLRGVWRSRRILFGVPTIALIAVAIGVSQGFAGSGRTVPIQKHVDPTVACGISQSHTKTIGYATFTRSGSTITVNWKVTGADPGSNYYLYLYDYDTCSYIDGYLGKFKVDSSGHGSKVGSTDASSYGNRVYACEYNGATTLYDCSLYTNP